MSPWPRVPLRPDNGGRAGAVDNHDNVQDLNGDRAGEVDNHDYVQDFNADDDNNNDFAFGDHDNVQFRL